MTRSASDGKEARENLGRYRLMGRIVAARLPMGEVVPGMRIRRDAAASRLGRPRNLRAELGRSHGGFLSAGPSEIAVESDAVVEMRVRAKDETEAVQRAQQNYIRPLTAALMLTTGRIAHVELTRIAPDGADGRVLDEGWSVWSDHGMVSNLGEMTPMSDDELSLVRRTMGTLHRDRVAASAAADLVEGAKMQWTTGGRQSEIEASVLRRFLVIERIATRVASVRSPEPSERDRQHRIVSDLVRDLHRMATDSAVRRIKNAARALQEAEGQRLTRDIAFTCEHLGLPEEVGAIAIDLNRLRNQCLAHPGRSQPHHRLAEAIDDVTLTAEAFLRAYADWRSNKS